MIKGGVLRSPSVIKSLKQVSRELFLPQHSLEHASIDAPLPIGRGQTVSAPHMVAIMNEALELKLGHNVLELGTGCGWHAATIGEIVASKDSSRSDHGHVYTMEIVEELAKRARENVLRHGFGDRVTVIQGDGSLGYPAQSPYDRIVVTAAAPDIPPPLVEQLKIGGLLIIPVGNVHSFQSLIRVRKKTSGSLIREKLGGVAFVPLVGQFGHKV